MRENTVYGLHGGTRRRGIAMKKTLIVPLAGALVFAATAAFADNVNGKVTMVDPKAHQVTLDNGTTYTAQASVDLTNIQVGDNVTATTETQGSTQLIDKIDKSS
jgi:uncharacterized protein YqfA (UPF0365 family)